MSQSSGQVTHVLLTRSRLCPRPKPGSSLHLHVLSTPPAFVLSQDQTLHESLAWFQIRTDRGIPRAGRLHCQIRKVVKSSMLTRVHRGTSWTRRVLFQALQYRRSDRKGSNLDATFRSHVLLSFQRPLRPQGGASTRVLDATDQSSTGERARAKTLCGLDGPHGPASSGRRRDAQARRSRRKRRRPT